MGASVGCEPSCSSDDLVVVTKPPTINRGTQAPRGYSSDGSAHGSARENAGNQSSALGSSQSLREEAAWEAQQALRGVEVPKAADQSGEEEPDAFSTLPLASKGVGTDERAEEHTEHPRAAEATGGVFASQSSGIHTVLAEDSPRDFGGTFGHAEAAALDLVPGNSLGDGGPGELESPMGTLDLPQQRAATEPADPVRGRSEEATPGPEGPRDHSADVTIEKEPSIQSGGTIIPDDLVADDGAAMGAPAQSAFSFAPIGEQLRSPSDELTYAECLGAVGAGSIGVGHVAASSSREARARTPGYSTQAGGSAHNPQEGGAASLSQFVNGMKTSSAAASAARRQAAESKLAQMAAQGDPGSLVDAKIKVKEWQWQLKMEVKSLEREIKKVKADESKLQKQLQAEGQKGNTQHVQQLARSIVRSRHAVRKLESAKVSMNDLNLQLTTCAAAMSMKHAVRISADTMQGMSAMATMEELASAVEQLQVERHRGSAMDGVLEDAFADEQEETEAALEVQKLLEEFALDRMSLLASMGPAVGQAAPSAATLAARQAPLASGREGGF